MCSAQICLFSAVPWFCALWYVVQVFSEWFWDGSSCPCYYWYHFCFYLPQALYSHCKVFISENCHDCFLSHISVSWNCNIYWYTCSFFIITHADVWFIDRDGSVGLHCCFCIHYLFLLILVQNSLSILFLFNNNNNNNQCYNGYLPLGIVSYWLPNNCVQELGSWTEEWEELHNTKTILWLQIHAPLVHTRGVRTFTYRFWIMWPQTCTET